MNPRVSQHALRSSERSPSLFFGLLALVSLTSACSDEPVPAPLGGQPTPVVRDRAVCGDGVTQTGEACDDGNMLTGDGCDALCQVEEPVGGEPVGGDPVGGEPVGGEPVGGEPVGGEPVGGEPVGGEPVGGEPVGGEPVGGEPVGGEPVGGEPVGGEPVGGEPVGGEPVGGEPVACVDDAYEDNDTRATASPLARSGFGEPLNLTLCSGDEDHFRVAGCAGATLNVTLTQLEASDLDVQLLSQNGTQLAISNTDQAVESVRHVFSSDEPAYLRVYGFRGSEGAYTLALSLEGCASAPECALNSDCGLNEVCEAGSCVPAPPECALNSDCGLNEVCEAGACVPAPPECALNSDCGLNEVCEAGSCVPAPPECALNSDCGLNEVCEAGSCVPAPPECRFHADCEVGELCEAGRCVAAPCVLDSECGLNEVCEAGVCSPAPAECAFDSDCPVGASCAAGQCVFEGVTCKQNSECAVGAQCEVGQCVELSPLSNPAYCDDSFDCGLFERCVDSLCVPEAERVECALNSDCGPLSDCVEGSCVAPTLATSCSVSSECGSYRVCEAGECVYERDRVEDNDDLASAEPFAPNTYSHLTINSQDEDWFKTSLCAGGTIDVEIRFHDDLGDIDLKLYDSQSAELDFSTGVRHSERVSYTNDTGAEALIYSKVYGFSTSSNAYDLYIRVSGCDLTDDVFESELFSSTSNDMPNEATAVVMGEYRNLSVTPADWDFYSAELCAGGRLNLALGFSDADGDIDVKLYDEAERQVASATSGTDDERVSYTSALGGRVYWRVYGFQRAENIYDMSVLIEGCDGLERDRLEDNNSLVGAELLTPNLYSNLTITRADEDWVGVDVCAGGELEVQVDFTHALGDLDLELFNAQGELINTSLSASNQELIAHSVAQAQRLYARVYGFGGETNRYDLRLRVNGCP